MRISGVKHTDVDFVSFGHLTLWCHDHTQHWPLHCWCIVRINCCMHLAVAERPRENCGHGPAHWFCDQQQNGHHWYGPDQIVCGATCFVFIHLSSSPPPPPHHPPSTSNEVIWPFMMKLEGFIGITVSMCVSVGISRFCPDIFWTSTQGA